MIIIFSIKSYISCKNNIHTPDFSLILNYDSLPTGLPIFSKFNLQKMLIFSQFNRFFSCDILKSTVEIRRKK